MTKGYYENGKRGWEGGVPVWRPAWWDELGNDAEYKEAIKPRTAFKAPYYADGHRMTIDGIPTRVASYVKGWAPWMKRALYKGTEGRKESRELEQQLIVLFPYYVPVACQGNACCTQCRSDINARYGDAECWTCKRNESEQVERDWHAYEAG